MLKRHNILPTRTSFFILSAGKIESVQEFKIKLFFYRGFLSLPFTNHRTVGEGGGYFSNSSLPLPAGHEPGTFGFRAQVVNH